MSTISIYTPHISERVKYAFNLIFKEIFGADEVHFSSNLKPFANLNGIKVNYSHENLDDALTFIPHGLLHETDIKPVALHVEFLDDCPIFFQTTGGDMSFDPFAAAFYLVSRYEEYLPFQADDHGRFPAEESLGWKNNFLQIPVVNIWADRIKNMILAKWPQSRFNMSKYSFTATVDIDNVYAFRHKGLKRTAGALLRDVLKGKFAHVGERIKVLSGSDKDPYDTFDEQFMWYKQAGVPHIYFLLFAHFGPFDRNISMHSRGMTQKIKDWVQKTDLCLHPSYRSNESLEVLQNEILEFASATRKSVIKSRQHYLKMSFPETYNRLEALGITADYSMGYASHAGFRAGIAQSFLFFNVQENKCTRLRVHPFMLMDVTYIDYQKQSIEQAWEEMKALADRVKSVHGALISVFHNRVFSEHEAQWKGWKDLYQKFLNYAKP